MTVIDHIIKIRIYTYKTVEEMAENMEGLTQISLFNELKINCFTDFCLNKFINQFLHSLAITGFPPWLNGRKKQHRGRQMDLLSIASMQSYITSEVRSKNL